MLRARFLGQAANLRSQRLFSFLLSCSHAQLYQIPVNCAVRNRHRRALPPVRTKPLFAILAARSCGTSNLIKSISASSIRQRTLSSASSRISREFIVRVRRWPSTRSRPLILQSSSWTATRHLWFAADDSDCRPRNREANEEQICASLNAGGDDNRNRPQILRTLRLSLTYKCQMATLMLVRTLAVSMQFATSLALSAGLRFCPPG